MMKSRSVMAVVVLAASGCHSAPAPAPAPVSGTRVTRTSVVVGERFQPLTSDSALSAFVPEIAPMDSGGECDIRRSSGSGATFVSASFPTRAAARMRVGLAFDSLGHLVRYTEQRGVWTPHLPPRATPTQVDSAIHAAINATRSTNLSIDYALDQAVISNTGGSRPQQGVLSTVRAMESRENLGNPRARLERVRKLCGV